MALQQFLSLPRRLGAHLRMRGVDLLIGGPAVDAAEQEVQVQVDPTATFLRKLFAFSGPGLMVAVGYMDPGNWATDLAGGARFGYALLSVILISNIVAIILQHLSLKLGIVTGRDLAQACRDNYSRPVSFALWVLCEIAIAACDLAEIVGSAIAINLLFGTPLPLAVAITVFDVFLILVLQHRGYRWLEAVIATLILTIGGCFAYELVLAHPDWGAVANGFRPSAQIVTNPEMLYIAIGILGATVMPHNLYLHSRVVQTRGYSRDPAGRTMAVRFATMDSTVALVLAFLVNASILILSAAVFHGTSHENVADIRDAHRLLAPTLGAPLASVLFAVALLASGQNSTITGTMAGQIVMEGFLHLRLRPWVRRLLTRGVALVPAMLVAITFGESGIGELLILSQVILSAQLAFAVVPLVQFTSSKRLMGEFANSLTLSVIAWLCSAVIIVLNGYLLVQVIFT